MPWKFVSVLVILAVVLLFVAFNINNTSNISFGVYTAEEVPIFLSLFISFFLGFLVTLPFALSSSRRKTKAIIEKRRQKKDAREERKKRKNKSGEEPPRLAHGGGNSDAR
ncbi:MAG: LapA family protein [Alkalispirochaetaceae bacterium]